ncbi:unnamed protein product [Lota lota]
MADGLRCKRRKQANPRRNSVTNFNNGLEASSDSDDEDKLHIVEEDSLQEPDATANATAAAVANGDQATPTDASHDASAVLAHNGSWNGVNGEGGSEEEEDMEEEEVEGEGEEEETKDALVEKILQQGDTAVIYPEAPEEECTTPDRGGADENGLPDTFSQLHTCPYCSRGYKRNASLKEHIKYRHETSDDNFSCSQCSYTFTYRSQLERHMSHHKGSREQRHVTPATGGNRKFKCNECAKAFKYKHHLKEHLRIHSGEKPYECSNCKKRFSHSGSYSSHISSKKCVGVRPADGATRTTIKPAPPAPPTPTSATTAAAAVIPARILLKEKSDSKPLQEQLPLTQIKSEPVEYECKPATAAATTAASAVAVAAVTTTASTTTTTTTTLPHGLAMVVPTVGLMSPISINLGDLQSVLKVAMDGSVLRQVLGTANGLVMHGKQGLVLQQPHQQIISLPAFVDQDGNTKIIINYSINPAHAAPTHTTTATTNAAAVQTHPLLLKREQPATTAPVFLTAAAATTTTTTTTAAAPTQAVHSISGPEAEKTPTDLSVVKTEPASPPPSPAAAVDAADGEPAAHNAANAKSIDCLLCEDDHGAKALRALQGEGKEGEGASLDPSFAALLTEAGVTLEEPPADRLVPLLAAYFSSNAHPDAPELGRISESAGVPVDVVRRWFDKMNSGNKSSAESQNDSAAAATTATADPAGAAKADGLTPTPQETPSREPPADAGGSPVAVKSEPRDPEQPEDAQAEPLDLSLPKQGGDGSEGGGGTPPAAPPAQAKQQEQPLNLSCLRKTPAGTIYVTAAQAGSIVAGGQLPTLVAIAGHQGTVNCLRAINTTTKRTILIPQLTYTYTTTAGSTGAKTVLLNGHKDRRQDSGSEGTSAVEEQNDSDSASPSKKRRLENGVYPCDLCSKVFQKGSSLLRHKYEHTGKRPHECAVCKKAFKHKHHLIEHSRLHSGEKPYACDKCGKRFSHSGSYSQHMNHRYSYCKKDGPRGPGPHGGPPGSRVPGDQEEEEEEEEEVGGQRQQPDGSGTTTPHSQLDSDEKESEEEEEEEEEEGEEMEMEEEEGDEDDEAMCMEDIRVVQVDDDDYEEEGGVAEAEQEEEDGVSEKEEAQEGEDGVAEEEEEGGASEKEEVQEEEGVVTENEEAQEEEGVVAEKEEAHEEDGETEKEEAHEEEGGAEKEEAQEEEVGVAEEEEAQEEEGVVAEKEEAQEEEVGVAEEEEAQEEEGGMAEEQEAEEEEGRVAEEEAREEGGVAEKEEAQEEAGGVAEEEEAQEEESRMAEGEGEPEREGEEDMAEVEEMEEGVGEEVETVSSQVVAVKTAEEKTSVEGEIREESKGVQQKTGAGPV